MAPPIFSSTPATPRSDEKTAKARTANNKQISTVSAFRLISFNRQDYKITLSLRRLRLCGRGAFLRRFGDRFNSALVEERNDSAAPEPDTLRVLPCSIRFY